MESGLREKALQAIIELISSMEDAPEGEPGDEGKAKIDLLSVDAKPLEGSPEEEKLESPDEEKKEDGEDLLSKIKGM